MVVRWWRQWWKRVPACERNGTRTHVYLLKIHGKTTNQFTHLTESFTYDSLGPRVLLASTHTYTHAVTCTQTSGAAVNIYGTTVAIRIFTRAFACIGCAYALHRQLACTHALAYSKRFESILRQACACDCECVCVRVCRLADKPQPMCQCA